MKRCIARVILSGMAVFVVSGALYIPVFASETENGLEETVTVVDDSDLDNEEDLFVESYVEENDGENENNQGDLAELDISGENGSQDEMIQEDLIVPEPSEDNDSIVVEETVPDNGGQAPEGENENESSVAGAPAEAEEIGDLAEADDASDSVTDSVGLPLLPEQENASSEDSVDEPGMEEEIPAAIPANDVTENDIVTGWYEEYGARYYADENGNKVTGWMLIDGKQYYFDPDNDGAMVTGEKSIDGSYYRFREDGAMVTGWYQDEYNWERYYYLADGSRATGWQMIDGKKYYFSDYGELYSDGEYTINNEVYRFDDSGALVTGWYQDPYNEWVKYYYLADGKKASSWQKINEKWYYFDSDFDGRMITGEEYINGSYYHFREDGSMVTGWYLYAGNWYYYLASGKEASGWQKINQKWYYFDLNNDGRMTTGEKYCGR